MHPLMDLGLYIFMCSGPENWLKQPAHWHISLHSRNGGSAGALIVGCHTWARTLGASQGLAAVVPGLWQGEAIELAARGGGVGAHVAPEDPGSLLQLRHGMLLQDHIETIAGGPEEGAGHQGP